MAAIGARLNSISGLRGYGYAPDNPSPPAAFPLVPAVPSYREAMKRGLYVIPFQVVVLTGAQLDRAGQQRMLRHASPTGDQSVRAALEDGDRTLGGLVDDLIVDSFDPTGLQDVGLINYFGGIFTVRVMASGV